ncbi:MAG: hypothetical protein ACE5FT_05085 [Candidatus Nanoarchaeia archaeon]
MINKKEFRSIRKELESHEKNREKLIQASREMIKLSKEVIHALHRDDLKLAKSAMANMDKAFKSFPKRPWETNMGHMAMQEYVEAAAYFYLMTKKRLPTRKELKVDNAAYLTGLCDLTGELVRKAYKCVIQGNLDEAKKLAKFVDDLYYEFLQLKLRGDLRKKGDAIKYNLAKLEDVVYNISLRK